MKYVVVILTILALVLVVGCQSVVDAPEETEMEEVVEDIVEETVDEEVANEQQMVVAGEIQVLGKEGFSPESSSASVGDTVNFVNADPTEKGFSLVIDPSKGPTTTSNLVKAGEMYSLTFEETGTYDFWTVGYGVRGSVTVE
jgi:plastocyanin